MIRRPEKTWMFRPKVSTFRQKKVDISSSSSSSSDTVQQGSVSLPHYRTLKHFGQNKNSFTESSIISRGNKLVPFSGNANITEQLHIMTLRLIDNSTNHDNHIVHVISTFLIQAFFLTLSCLLWKAAFSLLYSLSSPLLRTSLLSSAIFTASSDSHFVTFFLLAFGTLLSAVSFTMSRISLHSSACP